MRKQQGWSQSELAQMTNSTLSHINKLETGKYNPSLPALVSLAKAFGVSLDDLVLADPSGPDLERKSALQVASLIETLDPEDRKTILGMLKTMLTNKRIQTVLSEKGALLDFEKTEATVRKSAAGKR